MTHCTDVICRDRIALDGAFDLGAGVGGRCGEMSGGVLRLVGRIERQGAAVILNGLGDVREVLAGKARIAPGYGQGFRGLAVPGNLHVDGFKTQLQKTNIAPDSPPVG